MNELPYFIKYPLNPGIHYARFAYGKISCSIQLSEFLRGYESISQFKPSFAKEQPLLYALLNDAFRKETNHWLKALNHSIRVLRLYPYERNKQDYLQWIKDYQKYLEFIEVLLIKLQGFSSINRIVTNSSQIEEFQFLISNLRPIMHTHDSNRLPPYSVYFLDCLSACLDLCKKYSSNTIQTQVAA